MVRVMVTEQEVQILVVGIMVTETGGTGHHGGSHGNRNGRWLAVCVVSSPIILHFPFLDRVSDRI